MRFDDETTGFHPFGGSEAGDPGLLEFEDSPVAEWIALEPPAKVERGIEPGALHLDEARIGKSPYEDAIACKLAEDDRKPFSHMLERPNRWICKLQVALRDPDDDTISVSLGSGLLIGERHVLTAAHVLMEPRFGADGKFRRALDAAAVVVIPGLNGRGRHAAAAAAAAAADTMPFGWTFGTAFRAARVFRLALRASGSQPKDFDYALIRLAEPIGARKFKALGGAALGWWAYAAHGGRTRIGATKPGSFKGVKVNAAGYPQDKCRDRPIGRVIGRADYESCATADLGSVPWYSFDRIASSGAANASFATLELDNDAAPGMSGGPVWLRWRGVRKLIGILHGCDATKSGDDPFVGSIATLVTAAVERDIAAWLRQKPAA